MAWQWLAYSTKHNAKVALLDAGFAEEIDFMIIHELPSASVPRPAEKISLTVDCLKSWAMMSGTEQGKLVRKYFLDCERIAKSKQVEIQKFDIPETLEDALILAANQIKARKLAEAKVNHLQCTLRSQAPAVDFALAVQASPNSIDRLIGGGKAARI